MSSSFRHFVFSGCYDKWLGRDSATPRFGGVSLKFAALVGFSLGASSIFVFLLGASSLWAQTPTPAPTPTPVPPVSADTVNYQPTEIKPGVSADIYRPVPSRDTRCDSYIVSSPSGDVGEWGFLNCQVKRVVEGIVAVGVGASLLAVVWAGVHLITSVDERGRSGDRVRRIIGGAVFGVIAMLCCYILASLLDLGLQLNLPGHPGTYLQ